MAVDVMAGLRKAARAALAVKRRELETLQREIGALEQLAGGNSNATENQAGRRRNQVTSKRRSKNSQADSIEHAVKLVKVSGKEWKIRELNARLEQENYRKVSGPQMREAGLKVAGKNPWATVAPK